MSLTSEVVTLADLKQKPVARGPCLADLAEGPYFTLALMLDASALCSTDASCRLLRQLNRANMGPWRALGDTAFHGIELEREGTFEKPELDKAEIVVCGGRKLARMDWKGRYHHFRKDVPTFCSPFHGQEINTVAHPDEVAYFRSRLCTDVLSEEFVQGIYLEVDVVSNPDNLSMAVVDFEDGGCSSVTFSPDTGAVIRERKVREAPRKVEGEYIQPLPSVPPTRPFHGFMGLYLHRGRLAFFRRCELNRPEGQQSENVSIGYGLQEFNSLSSSHREAAQIGSPPARPVRPRPDSRRRLGPWETTGFVSDFSWAEGRRLTPCLAFRDEGAYRVRIVAVGAKPPIPVPVPPRQANSTWIPPGVARSADSAGWSGFDWEVGGSESNFL